MKKLVLFLFMLLLVVVSGCSSVTGDDDNGNGGEGGTGGSYTVFGSARLNNVDGSGISGAQVNLVGPNTNRNATTDANGNFTFNNVANGTYVVAISRTGYTFEPSQVPVTVSGVNVYVQTFVGTTSGGGGTTNPGTHTLYPMKLNATWTYSSVTVYRGYTYEPEEYIEKITGTIPMGERNYWVLYCSYDDDVAWRDRTNYMRIENNILYSYFTESMFGKVVAKTSGIVEAQGAPKMSKLATDDVPVLKFGVSPGTSWTVYSFSYTDEGDTVNMDFTARYIGTENSGDYSNCAKYELELIDSYSSAEYSFVVKATSVIWLASNVGPVKVVDKYYWGDNLNELELVETTTNTLKNYNIP